MEERSASAGAFNQGPRWLAAALGRATDLLSTHGWLLLALVVGVACLRVPALQAWARLQRSRNAGAGAGWVGWRGTWPGSEGT